MAATSSVQLARDCANRIRQRYFAPDWIHPGLVDGQYALVIDILRRHCPAPAKILDFGAGGADVSAVAALLGNEVEAADDLDDNWHHQDDNRRKIFDFAADFNIRYTLLERGRPFQWPPESFDMVMLHHVLEHFPDSPRVLLNTLLARVKPGGLLFVTVHNAGNLRKRIALLTGGTNLPRYGEWYWTEGPCRGRHREHVASDLADMARFLGLHIVDLRSYHSMIHVVPRKLRPAYRAFTTLFPGCRDSWSLLARKPEGWQPRLTPEPGDLPKRHDPRE